MKRMPVRFGLRTLFVATAAVGVWIMLLRLFPGPIILLTIIAFAVPATLAGPILDRICRRH